MQLCDHANYYLSSVFCIICIINVKTFEHVHLIIHLELTFEKIGI